MQLSGTATLSVSSCSNLGVIPSGPRAELDFSVLIISLPQRSRNLPRSIWILWVVALALADCPGFWLGKRIRSNQLELQPFHHYLSQSCHLHWEAPLLSWCWSCSWCMCRISFCHWCWQLNPAPYSSFCLADFFRNWFFCFTILILVLLCWAAPVLGPDL